MTIQFYTTYFGDGGGKVDKALCYKSEGHWLDSIWFHRKFIDIILPIHYGPGVDSASNRNEYRKDFLGVNAAGA